MLQSLEHQWQYLRKFWKFGKVRRNDAKSIMIKTSQRYLLRLWCGSESFHDTGQARASGGDARGAGVRLGREGDDARAPVYDSSIWSQLKGSGASSAMTCKSGRVLARLLDLESHKALGMIG